MQNSSRWPTSLSVISCAERCRITSPIAENSAAHRAISAAMSTFDIGDPLEYTRGSKAIHRALSPSTLVAPDDGHDPRTLLDGCRDRDAAGDDAPLLVGLHGLGLTSGQRGRRDDHYQHRDDQGD